jgi:putative transposase
MNIFGDMYDRDVFLRMLSEASERYGLANHGYTLMTNHHHLVSIPERETSLAQAMHHLLGTYAAYYNKRYSYSGRLWQGRFYSAVLEEPHFWAALRYVERNPVRAGMVEKAENYPWSSAAAHCGLREDPWLAPLPQAASRLGSWSEWLREGEAQSEADLIRRCTKTGRPCGSDQFLRALEVISGRILIPRRRRLPKSDGRAFDFVI